MNPDSLPGPELDRLLASGWYRMHQSIFTTTHLVRDEFYRVHWLRYPLAEIRERASHRRIRRRNETFRHDIESLSNIGNDHEELYSRYRQSIDFPGPHTVRQALFGEEGIDKGVYNTRRISVYEGSKLVAAGYFDLGVTSGTSIVHFYDPDYARCSPGKYLMLLTADYLKSAGYVYYYPGYVMAGDEKMDYKLFMGNEATEYFDAEDGTWKHFTRSILAPESLTLHQQMELLVAFGG